MDADVNVDVEVGVDIGEMEIGVLVLYSAVIFGLVTKKKKSN